MRNIFYLLVLVLLSSAFIGCGGGGGGGGGNATSQTSDGLATVKGYVYSPNGSTPIARALCKLTEAQTDRTTYTNSEGYFEFTDVSTGNKTLTISAGALNFTKSLTVANNQVVDLGGTSNPIQLGSTTGSNTIHMAVIEGVFDSIQSLLTDLGFPEQTEYDANASGWVRYSAYNESGRPVESLLSDSSELAKYDIIFINCGTYTDLAEDATVKQNLQAFVQNGGMVYASDQSYPFIEQAWPQYIDFAGDDTTLYDANQGNEGQVLAQVNSPLNSVLGKNSMDVNFDLFDWAMIDDAPESPTVAANVTVLIEGSRPTYQSISMKSGHGRAALSRAVYPVNGRYPLMVQFTYGNGKVLYTSFHNEAQATNDMKTVLSRIALGGI